MTHRRCTSLITIALLAGWVTQTAHATRAAMPAGAADDDGPALRMAHTLSMNAAPGNGTDRATDLPETDRALQDNKAETLPLRLAHAIGTNAVDRHAGSSGNAVAEGSTSAGAEQSLAVQALLEKYYRGEYREVGPQGLTLLDTEPDNHALRFAVANSLAWSGQSADALTQYQALTDTEYRHRALLGLGNVNRWNGRPHRAAQAYREILSKEPDNADAREGLMYADRELRPRTGLTLGRASNSSDTSRSWITASHRWRTGSGATGYELTAGRGEENRHALRQVQRDLSLRYENLDASAAPQIEFGAQQSPRSKVFGELTLRPANGQLEIAAGLVNWGKLSFDPAALRDGLTARKVGLRASHSGAPGAVRFGYTAYRISDGNLIQDAHLHYTPALQPFGSYHFRAYVGVDARKARVEDPRYWSPQAGHYSAHAGISGDWTNLQWQVAGSIQYGLPLTNDSGRSWSSGVGIKRWLGDHWAVGLDVWAIHTPRDGGYRYHSGMASIERLW